MLDGDDPALVVRERGEVGRLAAGRGAEVEDRVAGRRRDRAGDGHRGARLGHEQALLPQRRGERVERRVDDEALRQAVGRVRATGRRSRSSAREIRSVLARSAASAGSLPAAISARAASGPSASNHSSAIHSGCEWRSAASAGVASGSASTSARASRDARRSTALTSVAPRREDAFASSTDSPTAAWAGTRSRNASWKTPSRSAATHRRLELADRPAGERLDHVVERRAPLDRAVGELRRERPLARRQMLPRGLAVKGAVRVRALLEYASYYGVCARTRGRDACGARCAPAGRRTFGRWARRKPRPWAHRGGKSPDFGLWRLRNMRGFPGGFG